MINIFLQLTVNKDQKLLHQLGFSDEQVLTVKTSGSGTPSGSSADSSTSSTNSSGVFSSSYAMEQVEPNSLKPSLRFFLHGGIVGGDTAGVEEVNSFCLILLYISLSIQSLVVWFCFQTGIESKHLNMQLPYACRLDFIICIMSPIVACLVFTNLYMVF